MMWSCCSKFYSPLGHYTPPIYFRRDVSSVCVCLSVLYLTLLQHDVEYVIISYTASICIWTMFAIYIEIPTSPVFLILSAVSLYLMALGVYPYAILIYNLCINVSLMLVFVLYWTFGHTLHPP